MTEELLIENIGGNCPVQAEGRVDGKSFYFRARGDRWSLSIATADPCGEPEWIHVEPYGEEGSFDAGWMSEEEARGFIDAAVARYRERDTGAGATPV